MELGNANAETHSQSLALGGMTLGGFLARASPKPIDGKKPAMNNRHFAKIRTKSDQRAIARTNLGQREYPSRNHGAAKNISFL
jgi:hypothetical protein